MVNVHFFTNRYSIRHFGSWGHEPRRWETSNSRLCKWTLALEIQQRCWLYDKWQGLAWSCIFRVNDCVGISDGWQQVRRPAPTDSSACLNDLSGRDIFQLLHKYFMRKQVCTQPVSFPKLVYPACCIHPEFIQCQWMMYCQIKFYLLGCIFHKAYMPDVYSIMVGSKVVGE